VRPIWICSPIIYASVVHSTWSSQTMWQTHTPTFNKCKKKKKVTLHMSTHGAMWGSGLTSLVVCVNEKFRDIRERNVAIRSEIWITNIHSLGFRDTRECVTLWGLILQRLGCNSTRYWTVIWIKKSTQICQSDGKWCNDITPTLSSLCITQKTTNCEASDYERRKTSSTERQERFLSWWTVVRGLLMEHFSIFSIFINFCNFR
jgi:hypothetical protein